MKNWIDRYIYAVGEKIPKKQRKSCENDLRMALKEAIISKTDEKKNCDASYELVESDVLEILDKFGSPDEIAKKYHSNPSYLIGPELFDLYKLVLVVVGLCVCFGIVVGNFISILSTQTEYEKILLKLPIQFLSGAFNTIGSVTAIFALIQYFSKEPGKLIPKTTVWQAKSLKPIPLPQSRIRRRETIVALTFTTLAIILFNFFPDRIAIYSITDQGTLNVPIFNVTILKQNMFYFNVFWAFQILIYGYHIKTRQWTFFSRCITIIISAGTLLIILKMASNPLILNIDLDTVNLPDYMLSVRDATTMVFKGFLALVVATTAYEVVRHVYYIFKKS